MAAPPDSQITSKRLYRTATRYVILAAAAGALFSASLAMAQYGRKTTASKGPRAVALLELAANGKGHIVPIVVMDEGKFYDASAYKAAPVPMALDSGTVYEAEKAGVSLGIFSISGALHSKDNRWVGAGTWEPAGSAPKKKVVEPKKHTDDELGGPPVLHRPGVNPAKAPPAAPQPKTPPAPPSPSATVTPSAPSTPPAPTTAPLNQSQSPDDPNRPMLRRGKPAASEENQDADDFPDVKPAPGKAGVPPATAAAQTVQVIPAISDSGGPEPRSFVYDAKPDQLETFRKKMLALATTELRAYEKSAVEPIGDQPPVAAKAKTAHRARPPQPNFEEPQTQIFDLSASNEPVLVFSARVLPPNPVAAADLQYFVTIVAREDIYGDLHKVAAKITDTQHTDALPRYELIDAVDVDGDGRAELMFRQISDAGKAYAIYRVIGDTLWPLYEGTPQ